MPSISKPLVHIGSCLIQYYNLVLPKDSPSKTKKLSLTNWKVCSMLWYQSVKPVHRNVGNWIHLNLRVRDVSCNRIYFWFICTFDYTLCNDFQMDSSVNSPKGSKFLRMVPENKMGSWGMTDKFFLKSYNLVCEAFLPQICIRPSGSTRRNSAAINDDLPAPVRPTTPIYKFCNK